MWYIHTPSQKIDFASILNFCVSFSIAQPHPIRYRSLDPAPKGRNPGSVAQYRRHLHVDQHIRSTLQSNSTYKKS